MNDEDNDDNKDNDDEYTCLFQGNVLHNLGNDRMAEKVLREAVNADTKSHQSW